MTTNVFFAKHVLFFLLYTFTIQEVLVLEICQHWQLYLRLDILICTCCLTQMNSLCATVITFLLWFGLGETWSPSSTASFPASWLFFGGIQSGSWKLHAFNVFMFFFFCSLSYPLPLHPPSFQLLLLTSPLHHCDCCLGNPWLLRQPHQACVPSVLIGPTRWTGARSRGTAWW